MHKVKTRARVDYPHLSDDQFDCLILRKTEQPGTGALRLADSSRDQAVIYRCANCDREVFSHSAKFPSGSGWPAFYEALEAVKEKTDFRIFESGRYVGLRREVICSCGGHLGHLFKGEKWDTPTGHRYCINSIALKDKPRRERVV